MKKSLKFNWILIKELAVGSAPYLDDHIYFLKDIGITGVLSLCDQNEIELSELLEKNFQHLSFPIPDHTCKRDLTIVEVFEALKKISELSNYGPVFVHCFAGIERSPLICMAWLVKYKGFTPLESLEYLMNVNKGTNPTPNQFKLLNEPLLLKNIL